MFREHSLACFITDPTALKIRNDIGIDIIAWECDYPHSDSPVARRPEQVLAEMQAPAPPTRRSTRSPGRTPAASSTGTRSPSSPKEQATVGALRALSPDVDTSTVSRAEWRRRYEMRIAS